MQLVAGFEPVLRVYYPNASRAEIKEWCSWCTKPKQRAPAPGDDDDRYVDLRLCHYVGLYVCLMYAVCVVSVIV